MIRIKQNFDVTSNELELFESIPCKDMVGNFVLKLISPTGETRPGSVRFTGYGWYAPINNRFTCLFFDKPINIGIPTACDTDTIVLERV